ncbi:hypothetical protein [Stratiformator vulcanicus]|uniref:Uncharacterized protein n=1 Tax=Stratiformator vulcanicus TaxID=2527980 RepID=A0A517QVM3_9PLAN|nr:hypothetical protein [Stratiformator vulcanicus]QDT35702.1 hypothetical protein Pan189_00550 [Stratiformator vulcanicus]
MAVHYAQRLGLIALAAVAAQSALSGAAVIPGLLASFAAGAIFYLLGFVFGEIGRRLAEEVAAIRFDNAVRATQETADDSSDHDNQ